MDIFEFTDRLCHKLEDMGISPKACEEYISRIETSLTENDLITANDNDIAKAAEICMTLYRKKHPENPVEESNPDSYTLTFDLPEENKSEEEIPAPNDTLEIELPDYDDTIKKSGTKGIFMTVLVTVLTSPLWVLAAAVFFAPFIILFAAEVALTAVFIGLLAGGCAAGTGASLTGIVYGIVQMFTTPSVGLYEIGFGVILVGVTLMFGVLAYNGAVRLMPFVFSKTAKLMGYAISKVKPFLKGYVRRCQSL